MARKNEKVEYKDFDDEIIPKEFIKEGWTLKRDKSGQFIEDQIGSVRAMKCPNTQEWCKGLSDNEFNCIGCPYLHVKIDTTTSSKKEAVNHPLHYGGDTPYECIKVLKAWVSDEEYRGFLRCNAIKYLCRTGKKDETVQELKKAAWYINKLIESYEA